MNAKATSLHNRWGLNNFNALLKKVAVKIKDQKILFAFAFFVKSSLCIIPVEIVTD